MASSASLRRLIGFCAFAIFANVHAAPFKRGDGTYSHLQNTSYGDIIFGLGNITYLANLQHPKAFFKSKCDLTVVPADGGLVPLTVVLTNESVITQDDLEETIAEYLAGDDVFNEDFLESLYLIPSAGTSPVLDASALQFLSNANIHRLFLDTAFSQHSNNITGRFSTTLVTAPQYVALPPGPYAAVITTEDIAFSSVYRLYRDEHRDFLFGAYDANDGDGNHNPLGSFLPHSWDPMIPVPSRIYYWNDDRPLAGERVAIKDLYDIKGLQTSGGSQAWATITPIANETAPAIKQIINLGGVLVGKFKLAQFASGANPWDWQDEHYPWNPRGDGYLTCSASSSGGGCSIAAYDWLDYAIGSDTGSSMRRPAAVSGTYGNRPSQGMIDLDRVIPLGDATDTAGVFSRDPYKWIKFAKAWYDPSLHQDPSITGLSPLVVPDTYAYPKRILYPVEYLPLANPAAETILQIFLSNVTSIFNMTVEKFNFTATVQNASDPIASNFTITSAALGVIDSYHQWHVLAKPLITAWAALFSGRFPPIDPQWRKSWSTYNESANTPAVHARAYEHKAAAVNWFEQNLLYSTNESCSESILIYDIGTGGLPSFREQDLNTDNPAASFLAVLPPTARITGANICPLFAWYVYPAVPTYTEVCLCF